MNLTPKQDAFCLAYIETGNASEAYRRAYDAGNMSDNAIHVAASRLLDNAKVALRVAELQAAHQVRHNITVDTLTDKLEAAREMAMGEVQPSAAVSATMGMAKLHGLLVDKVEAETIVNLAMSPEWHHLLTAILSALDPFPDARLAVADAMAVSEAEIVRH